MKFKLIIEGVFLLSDMEKIKKVLLSVENEIYSNKFNSNEIVDLLGKLFWKNEKVNREYILKENPKHINFI